MYLLLMPQIGRENKTGWRFAGTKRVGKNFIVRNETSKKSFLQLSFIVRYLLTNPRQEHAGWMSYYCHSNSSDVQYQCNNSNSTLQPGSRGPIVRHVPNHHPPPCRLYRHGWVILVWLHQAGPQAQKGEGGPRCVCASYKVEVPQGAAKLTIVLGFIFFLFLKLHKFNREHKLSLLSLLLSALSSMYYSINTC